jgi:hypothetical protein
VQAKLQQGAAQHLLQLCKETLAHTSAICSCAVTSSSGDAAAAAEAAAPLQAAAGHLERLRSSLPHRLSQLGCSLQHSVCGAVAAKAQQHIGNTTRAAGISAAVNVIVPSYPTKDKRFQDAANCSSSEPLQELLQADGGRFQALYDLNRTAKDVGAVLAKGVLVAPDGSKTHLQEALFPAYFSKETVEVPLEQLELSGLLKVAVEGRCAVPGPSTCQPSWLPILPPAECCLTTSPGIALPWLCTAVAAYP